MAADRGIDWMPNSLQLLRDMIAIPSVNPMGQNSGEPVEAGMANFIEAMLARAGIETVVCGPGDIAQAHTANEFVEVRQIELATRMYGHLLANWNE